MLVNRQSPEFVVSCAVCRPFGLMGRGCLQANYSHMKSQVTHLRELVQKISEGGPADLKERHRERHKMMARERIDALIDVG
jgi:hypothetical protein